MSRSKFLGSASIAILSTLAVGSAASGATFDIPPGNLKAALSSYQSQAGVLVVSSDAVNSVRSRGAKGEMSAPEALALILRGTGFVANQTSAGQIEILKNSGPRGETAPVAPLRVAAAASANVETVVVTSSKIKGDIQTVPIAITALSQEQLTTRQIAGGPDLVKEVPNLTFSKTNFTGYNIEIRGIGTQAISVATDPAVAVALNDIPFIRNHFFEQEFYDLSQAEVLRGPQGTLYGRNATAGVVNLVSAKPTDQFEAMLSADIGNYSNRRYEGMVNVPIVDDRLDIRVAAEWTKRDGYTFNETTGKSIDGRDLWSSRVTIGWKPLENMQTYFIWEHFSETDDRLNSGKQLCKKDLGPSSVTDWSGNAVSTNVTTGNFGGFPFQDMLSQGCLPTSLYAPSAFETPNGNSIPFVVAGTTIFNYSAGLPLVNGKTDPYASTVQSRNLRVIQSELTPTYKVKNDTLEFNADYALDPTLTLTSQTGYNSDFEATTQDFNNFNTAPGLFNDTPLSPGGVFCDPQLGCSNKLVGEDMSREHAWQLSQEFRLASNFSGPLNFSVGGNYLHYETDESFYVFANLVTEIAALENYVIFNNLGVPAGTYPDKCGYQYGAPIAHTQANAEAFKQANGCWYIDPNPIGSLNNQGHNYFLNRNPYVLNSYAGFGEAYYQLTPDVKFTGGLRWTDDQKHFTEIPSLIAIPGWGYPVAGVVNQEWNQVTGRFVADWTPKLDFTDQTLFYASYSRGYKAGGANPPPPSLALPPPTHPLTFNPEFVNAYEAGTKNTLGDGAVTLNADVFYYDYKGYQISQIVDRDAINLNINATVKGAELESTWEPAPGLKFTFAGGYESTRIAKNTQAIDLMDRTAGMPGWVVYKPAVTETSNCVLPEYVVAALADTFTNDPNGNTGLNALQACETAYAIHQDPIPFYYASYAPGYPGYDPRAGTPGDPDTGQNIVNGVDYLPPNNGTGFYKNLGGNELPNAPHFTTSLSAEYTLPVSENWAATLHSDFYWQSQSWARIFNDRPYDKIRGYSNVNLALILTSATGWQVMGYVKNIFDTTAITGDFLYSDDVGLTTNVFLTDPRLYGVRVTKNF
jgi:iron complex outermembrane recepter protein